MNETFLNHIGNNIIHECCWQTSYHLLFEHLNWIWSEIFFSLFSDIEVFRSKFWELKKLLKMWKLRKMTKMKNRFAMNVFLCAVLQTCATTASNSESKTESPSTTTLTGNLDLIPQARVKAQISKKWVLSKKRAEESRKNQLKKSN